MLIVSNNMFLIKSGIMSLSKKYFYFDMSYFGLNFTVRIRVRFKIKARFSIRVKDSVRIGIGLGLVVVLSIIRVEGNRQKSGSWFRFNIN